MTKKPNIEAETPIARPKEQLGEGDAPGWYLCEWRGQEQVLWWDGEMLRVMRQDSHRWKVDGETNFRRVVDIKQLSDALADAERELAVERTTFTALTESFRHVKSLMEEMGTQRNAERTAKEQAERDLAVNKASCDSLTNMLDRLGAAAEAIYNEPDYRWSFGEAISDLVEDAAKWKAELQAAEAKLAEVTLEREEALQSARHWQDSYHSQKIRADDATKELKVSQAKITALESRLKTMDGLVEAVEEYQFLWERETNTREDFEPVNAALAKCKEGG